MKLSLIARSSSVAALVTTALAFGAVAAPPAAVAEPSAAAVDSARPSADDHPSSGQNSQGTPTSEMTRMPSGRSRWERTSANPAGAAFASSACPGCPDRQLVGRAGRVRNPPWSTDAVRPAAASYMGGGRSAGSGRMAG